jgi:hypothetical protein
MRKVFAVSAAPEGVECRKDQPVIDETPAAYKPIEQVMQAQSDLMEIARTLKQMVCIKGLLAIAFIHPKPESKKKPVIKRAFFKNG